MDKFLAEFSSGSFNDLVAREAKKAKAAQPPASMAPPPPPAAKAMPSSVPAPSALQASAKPLQSAVKSAPAGKAMPTAANAAKAQPQEQPPMAQTPKAAPAQAQVEDEQAAAIDRGLLLYRAAAESCRQAAMVDAERSGDPTISDRAYSAAESQLAYEHRIRWQDRGPRGDSAPSEWRGQKWRAGSQRYANRGGDPQRNAWYAAQAKAKAKGKSKGNSKNDDKGKGKSKAADKGKGKSKAADKGKGKSKDADKGKGKSKQVEGSSLAVPTELPLGQDSILL